PFLIETAAVTRSRVRLCVLHLLCRILDSAIHWIEMEERHSDVERLSYWSRVFIERASLGADLFVRLLHTEDDADVRVLAAYLLGLLLTRGPDLAPAEEPDRYASAVAALIARLQSNEADDLVSPTEILALGRASAHDPSLIERLREV